MGKQRLSDGIDVHYGEYAISGVTVINSSRQLRNITALRIDATEIINSSRQLVNVAGYTQTSGNASIEHASSPTFELKDTTNNVTFKAYAQDSNAFVGTTSSHNLNIGTNNTTAVNINNSQQITVNNASTFSGAMTVNANIDLSSTDTATRYIHMPRGGGITLYGDTSVHHGIFSRNSSNSSADDVLISSYGAIYLDLDSNDNNTSGADFSIVKHNGTTSIFRIDGEDSDVYAAGNIYPGGSTGTYIGNSGDYVQIQTAYGYTRIGAGNATYSHFYTDRSRYYFNKRLQVDEGIIQSHNEDLQLRRTNSANDRIVIGDTSTLIIHDGSEKFKVTNTGAVTHNQAYTFPTSDGSNGQALITNGSGTLSFGSVSASVAGISTSANATAITISSSENVTLAQSLFLAQQKRINFGGLGFATMNSGGNFEVGDLDDDDREVIIKGFSQTSKITMSDATIDMDGAKVTIATGGHGASPSGTNAHSGGGQLDIKCTNASNADNEMYSRIDLRNNTAQIARIAAISEGSGNTAGHLEFMTRSSTSNPLVTIMRIRNNGSVQIFGTLSKTFGSFEIPHPLPAKKSTHVLRHSFIEGPQCDNIYRGTVTLSDGSATVNLDTVSNMTEGTFVLLNRDVQTFTTNESDWDAVKGSVSGNILTISCQNTSSTATVSWLVIGERQDDEIKSSKITSTDSQGNLIVEAEDYEGGT